MWAVPGEAIYGDYVATSSIMPPWFFRPQAGSCSGFEIRKIPPPENSLIHRVANMTNEDRRNELKAQIHEAAEMLIRIMEQPSPPPAIGIDLDGCIDEAPEFFRLLSKVWPGEVYVITYRSDQAKADQDVARFGIKCDEVVLVSRFDGKAEVIAENEISVHW